ncbi:MAG: YigZ family protein [Geothermobacteraceae bacterium]
MPSRRYPIPAGRFRCVIEVERSRFITTVAEAGTVEAAQQFISGIRAEFPDANHNCWAYLVGPPGSTDRIGLSDDGEPHGCAGKPMLTCLQHGNIGDVAVVVTRYFGGIKLGKGGMVKAYTAAVQTALEQMPKGERIDWQDLTVTLDYAQVTPFERVLNDYEIEVMNKQFSDRVCYRLRLPQERAEAFVQMFTNLTAGRGIVAQDGC